MSDRKKSIGYYFLAVLLFFQGISGLFGGVFFVIDPTGGSLQMPLSLLAGSPFESYLIPGWILMVVLGVCPSVVFYGLV